MRTGTNHFRSITAAHRYYRPYAPGDTTLEFAGWLKDKISAQEIVIGPPTLKPGERMYVNDEGRYVIETEKP